MSLRPSFSGFSLSRLRSLFGARDSGLITAIMQTYWDEGPQFLHLTDALHASRVDGELSPTLALSIIEAYAQEEPIVAEWQAYQTLLTAIIMGQYEQRPPEAETELGQQLMDDLARFDQPHHVAESGFWEAFMVEVAQAATSYPSEIQPLFQYLLHGRPLLGQTQVSTWAYYAYFTHAEAQQLFDFIRRQPHFQQCSDFVAAARWMKEIEASHADIWVYCS